MSAGIVIAEPEFKWRPVVVLMEQVSEYCIITDAAASCPSYS